jgi:hypothetical protein
MNCGVSYGSSIAVILQEAQIELSQFMHNCISEIIYE